VSRRPEKCTSSTTMIELLAGMTPDFQVSPAVRLSVCLSVSYTGDIVLAIFHMNLVNDNNTNNYIYNEKKPALTRVQRPTPAMFI